MKTAGKTLLRFIQETISRMDLSVWLATIGYFLVFAFIHYRWTVDFGLASFLTGVIVSLPVITAFELFIHLRRSLYHTIHFQLLLFLLTMFALSSTVQQFGKGAVLSLLFSSLITQGKEFLKTGSIGSWMGKGDAILTNKQQQLYFLVAIIVYTILTVYLA